jgi:imidazolonepropionase
MEQSPDTLFVGVSAATMRPGGAPYGLIEDAAVAVEGGHIVFVGPRADLPAGMAAAAGQVIDGAGACLTPGLIDCHTHLVHGGDRAREFEQRLLGVSYAEIARAGGGILSTVRATRELDEAGLVAASLPRLDALLAEGVTTVEIKSGYALEREGELSMLRAARLLARMRPVDVRATLLALHAVPPDFAGDADGYVDLVCRDLLPAAVAERLADAADAFCETIAFSPAQVRRFFVAARALDVPLKLHAEQLSDLGGAALAASFGALSADHLEYLDEAGVAAMAAARTVAVLLPGAFYMLREERAPPVAALRAAGVPMAVATDCNPGTSPISSLLTALNMACVLFRLTPEEALAGATRHAARALGLDDRGMIAPGLRADLALWRVRHPSELVYAMGARPLLSVMRVGELRG